MDNKEAHSILSEHLTHYRTLSYSELSTWVLEGRIDVLEIVAPSGTRYQIEIQCFWDDKPNSDVRVTASVGTFLPVTDSFILSPDGKFVGE